MKRVLTLVWLFVNACILITLIGAGNQIVEGLALTYFGVRPIGWVNTFLRAAWFCLVVPVYLVGFGVATWRLVGERERRPAPRVRGARQARPRSDFSTFSIIVTGVMSVGLYGWVFFVRVAPELGARTQRDVWPAAIELATFDVCAIETRKDWLGKELAFGRIAFEVVNRSPVALHEARFTVSGGRQYQYTLASLAPGEARRVEVHLFARAHPRGAGAALRDSRGTASPLVSTQTPGPAVGVLRPTRCAALRDRQGDRGAAARSGSPAAPSEPTCGGCRRSHRGHPLANALQRVPPVRLPTDTPTVRILQTRRRTVGARDKCPSRRGHLCQATRGRERSSRRGRAGSCSIRQWLVMNVLSS